MKRFVAVVLLSTLPLTFNACYGQPFSVDQTLFTVSTDLPSEADPSSESASYEKGVVLYSSKNCAGCHGSDVSTSTKFGLSLDRLNWSLAPGNVSAMSQIALSDIEKNSLVLALTMAAVEKVAASRSGRMMGRRYLVSVFKDVFQSTNFKNEKLETLIQVVAYSPAIFGTPCNLYSTYSGSDCGGEIYNNTGSSIFTGSTAVRQLKQLEACEKLTSDTVSLNAAIENAGGMGASSEVLPLTEERAMNAVVLFDLDRGIPDSQRKIYSDLVKKLNSSSQKSVDQWRLLIQLACEQPGWTLN